jgi:hypothetical protein
MSEFDWSRFVVRVPVNASKEKLYDAWATRKGMESWFLRVSAYKNQDGVLRKEDEHVQAGDTYAWRWHGWPDEVEEYGEIMACNGRDFFQFKFGDAGICTVTITEEFGQHIVALVQSSIPADESGRRNWHVGCKTGWTFYFANLKSIKEGGLDLRNKNADVKGVINA